MRRSGASDRNPFRTRWAIAIAFGVVLGTPLAPVGAASDIHATPVAPAHTGLGHPGEAPPGSVRPASKPGSGDVAIRGSNVRSYRTVDPGTNYSFVWLWGPPAGGVPFKVSFFWCPQGGTAPYSITASLGDGTWFHTVENVSENPCNATEVYTYTVVGEYSGAVWANDSAGHSLGGTFQLHAEAHGPTITAPTISPPNIDLGQSITVNVTAGGGTGVYTYNWLLPSGCTPANESRITCTPNATGSFYVQVYILDTYSAEAQSPSPIVIVYPDPTVDSFFANPSQIAANQSTTLEAQMVGGSGSFTSLWAGLPPGCPTRSNGTSITCVPTTAGAYSITATITDSFGVSTRAGPLTLSVARPLTVGPLVASASALDVNQSVRFAATVLGGAGPFRFTWQGLPPNCAAPEAAAVTCSPDENGGYSVALEVADALGERITTSAVDLTVNPLPTVTLVAVPGTVPTGEFVNVTANVSGGTGPFLGSFSGEPPGCVNVSSTQLRCEPATAGVYRIGIDVRDAAGQKATAFTNLTVVAAPSPPSIGASGLASLALWVVVPVVIIAAVSLAAFFVIRRRRSRAAEETELPPGDGSE